MIGQTSHAQVVRRVDPHAIQIAMVRVASDGYVTTFDFSGVRMVPQEVPDGAAPPTSWLSVDQDDARALYEALADHFGHTGHDMRALRQDYEAERRRVDKLLAYAMAPPTVINGCAERQA